MRSKVRTGAALPETEQVYAQRLMHWKSKSRVYDIYANILHIRHALDYLSPWASPHSPLIATEPRGRISVSVPLTHRRPHHKLLETSRVHLYLTSGRLASSFLGLPVLGPMPSSRSIMGSALASAPAPCIPLAGPSACKASRLSILLPGVRYRPGHQYM